MAEAIHSVADSGNQILLLVGGKHAKRAIEGDFWWVPLAVLTGAIIAGTFSFRTAITESNQVRLLVAAKITVGAAVSGMEIAKLIDAAEERARAAVAIARVIYLEPDIHPGTRHPPLGAAKRAGCCWRRGILSPA